MFIISPTLNLIRNLKKFLLYNTVMKTIKREFEVRNNLLYNCAQQTYKWVSVTRTSQENESAYTIRIFAIVHSMVLIFIPQIKPFVDFL